jgi:iron complex transport system substrate-binding protein
MASVARRILLLQFVFISALSCESRSTAPSSSPVAARRIISIAPDATEIVGSLGQTSRLVGVSTFCLYPSEVKKLPRVGGLFDPNLEMILQLRPDLVILRGHNRGVEELCERNGIQLFRDQTERLDDVLATVRELGRMLDCFDDGERAASKMKSGIERVRSATKPLPRPRVLVTVARRLGSMGQVTTASRGTFVGEMIDLAGGDNVFATTAMAYPQLSLEAILSAQPEVILELMPETPNDAALSARALEEWKALGPMPATRDGRVHVLTDENALIPSPRIVKVIEKMARLLHPEVRFD